MVDGFPDLCSFDWHAKISVNGTKDGVAFGPEPAEEWSSFNSQKFRYYLPQHDFYDSQLDVAQGGLNEYSATWGTIQWYLYTSDCCMTQMAFPSNTDCALWVSCNILALGWESSACSTANQWTYQGQATIDGKTCDHWTINLIDLFFQEIYVDTDSSVPVLLHWWSKEVGDGISYFEVCHRSRPQQSE